MKFRDLVEHASVIVRLFEDIRALDTQVGIEGIDLSISLCHRLNRSMSRERRLVKSIFGQRNANSTSNRSKSATLTKSKLSKTGQSFWKK